MSIVIFQIAAACYTLSLSKTVHNDLHLGNIMIDETPKNKITYIIDDVPYAFTTNVLVKIIDFNKSYSNTLGPNPILLDPFYNQYDQNNVFVENKDIVQVLRMVYSDGKHEEKSKFIQNVICPPSTVPYLEKHFTLEKLLEWEPIDYSKFYSTIKILRNIGEHLPKEESGGEIYTCNSRMFDDSGRLKIT
jgi:hypothetical protein